MRPFVLLATLALAASSSFAEEAFTIDQYLADLSANRYTKIEDAIAALPATVRSSFTLLYDGHGLRETTWDRPGALIFDPQGRFAITFGHRDLELGNELEIAKFDEREARFTFFRVPFPAESGSSEPVRVEKNPAVCLKCHGADPMFRWSRYATWPGVYGSDDDVIDTEAEEDDEDGIDEESRHFIDFLKAAPSMERYRELIMDNGVYASQGRGHELAVRPNFRLTYIVARRNGQRAARRAIESPAFRSNRYVLLYGLLGCPKALGKTETLYGTPIPALASVLKKLGMSLEDFQADLLKPVVGQEFPPYNDGGFPAGSIPGLPKNSIATVALAKIYSEILRLRPDPFLRSKLSYAFQYARFWTYFKDSPYSLEVLRSLDRMALPVSDDLLDDRSICEHVRKLL